MKTGPAIADILKKEGVEYLFAYPVNHLIEHAAALDMAEKPVAEPCAFMRALDQPGNVGEHELAALRIHDAELRMQRRERICRDLRPRSGDFPQQCRFACIRITNESCVRNRS